MTKQYYAVTNANNYIKLNATTKKEALQVLKNEDFERPEWGIKELAYIVEGSRDGLTFLLKSNKDIPQRLQ